MKMKKKVMPKSRIGSVVMAFLFALSLVVISLVSLYDCHLTEKYSVYLKENELNPIARLLLAESNWTTKPFIVLKLCGTSIVLVAILVLYRKRRDMAYAVCWGVTIFQICLLIFYLEFDDIMTLFM